MKTLVPDPATAEIVRLKAERDEALDALRNCNATIVQLEEFMVEYLKPDGMDQDSFCEEVIAVLDNIPQVHKMHEARAILAKHGGPKCKP